MKSNDSEFIVLFNVIQGWNCRGWGVEPPVHVYRRSFLSENRF